MLSQSHYNYILIAKKTTKKTITTQNYVNTYIS